MKRSGRKEAEGKAKMKRMGRYSKSSRLSSSLALGEKLKNVFFFFVVHLAGFIAVRNGYKGLREATVKAG